MTVAWDYSVRGLLAGVPFEENQERSPIERRYGPNTGNAITRVFQVRAADLAGKGVGGSAATLDDLMLSILGFAVGPGALINRRLAMVNPGDMANYALGLPYRVATDILSVKGDGSPGASVYYQTGTPNVAIKEQVFQKYEIAVKFQHVAYNQLFDAQVGGPPYEAVRFVERSVVSSVEYWNENSAFTSWIPESVAAPIPGAPPIDIPWQPGTPQPDTSYHEPQQTGISIGRVSPLGTMVAVWRDVPASAVPYAAITAANGTTNNAVLSIPYPLPPTTFGIQTLLFQGAQYSPPDFFADGTPKVNVIYKFSIRPSHIRFPYADGYLRVVARSLNNTQFFVPQTDFNNLFRPA